MFSLPLSLRSYYLYLRITVRHHRSITSPIHRTALSKQLHPLLAFSRADYDTSAIHNIDGTAPHISVIVPPNLVKSALASKLLPWGPASFYNFISQYLMNAESTRPSKSWGEWVCREYSITPKDLGTCAKFILMTTDLSIPTAHAKNTEEIRSIRYRLAHHMFYTAAMMGDPDAVVTQYQFLHSAPKHDRILALELHDAVHRLKEVAKTGHGPALYQLAKHLEERGKYQEAKTTYIEAGDAGMANGYAHGGRLFNAIDKDRKQAEFIWRIGAEKFDNARCYSYLANLLREEHPEYEQFMTQAAASGIPNAAYNLGNFYCNQKNDLEMGMEWFVVAAVTDDGAADWAVANLKSILRGQKGLDGLSSLIDVTPERMLKIKRLEQRLGLETKIPQNREKKSH